LKVLFIGDNDLYSRGFNGYNYIDSLKKYNVDATMLVGNKMSNSNFVYQIDHTVNNFTLSILKNKFFVEADIIHLHLIHNTPFDINYLPLITRLKPTIISLHDPYFLSGHCIYHFDCEKWKNCCMDCELLNIPFTIVNDDVALMFFLKKTTIYNSYISAIVASEWMLNLVKQSPIWYEKSIYLLPYWVNKNIFTPCNSEEAKGKLGIDNSITLMFRMQNNIFKGIDIIKYALEKINIDPTIITLITVGQKGLLNDLKNKFKIIEFDWITDDVLLSQLYQACDIFLMPSRQEAFGLMAAEAMCCGKMILATHNTALECVINHPECGIAVEHNSEIFLNELQRLLDNVDEIKIRGNKSYEYAKAAYCCDNFYTNLLEIYNNTIEQYNTALTKSYKDNICLVLQQLKKHNTRVFIPPPPPKEIGSLTIKKKIKKKI
jgi:glycosyltransferase involved in cell wall biosynthesis